MKTLKQRTMRSIYAIYVLKRALHPFVLKAATLFILLWSLGALVWVSRVFENLPTGLYSMIQYITNAFLQTEVLVQFVSVGIVIVIVWMLHDIARIIAPNERTSVT
jgi:hypothetical protein